MKSFNNDASQNGERVKWERYFGPVPKDWTFVPFGNLFRERKELSADRQTYPLYSFTIEDGVTPKTERYERGFLLRDKDNNRFAVIHPGDLIFNPMNLRFGAIGFSKIAFPVLVSAYYVVLIPDGSKCERVYLESLLRSELMMNMYDRVAIGSLIEKRRVHLSSLNQVFIPLPSLEEQVAISQILITWNDSIAIASALVDKKMRLRHGLVQQVLTGNRRFPGFDKEWRRNRLEEIAEVNPGFARDVGADEEVAFLGMADVGEGFIHQQQRRKAKDVSFGFTRFSDGDVLVPKITPCFENGKGCHCADLIGGVGFGSTEFVVLRTNNGVLPRLLFHHTMSFPFRSKGGACMSGTAGQQRLQTDFIRSYSIRLPETTREQQKVTDLLDTIEDEIKILRRQLETLKLQKKGLMQKLLTGKVRVNLPKGVA